MGVCCVVKPSFAGFSVTSYCVCVCLAGGFDDEWAALQEEQSVLDDSKVRLPTQVDVHMHTMCMKYVRTCMYYASVAT